MTEQLSLKDIEIKLNEAFDSGQRIIFWYDIEGSFEDSVDEMELNGASVWHLTENNSFRTKIMLEHEDEVGKYLIYAPFEKPDIRQNHLEDIFLYSTPAFYADRMSLIISKIKAPDNKREALRNISKFFGVGIKQTTKKERNESEKRASAFVERAEEINLDTESNDIIPIIAMCVLTDARNATLDDLIYSVYAYGDIESNEILDEFSKYDLTEQFWSICAARYGYHEDDPNLIKLLRALFATYTSRDMVGNIPKAWESYILSEKTNVNVLLDNMMNSVLYSDTFDKMAETATRLLDIDDHINNMPLEGLHGCAASPAIDKAIIKWMNDRILDENRLASMDGKTIDEICNTRLKAHYGKRFKWEYKMLTAAYEMLSALDFEPGFEMDKMIEAYIKEDYQIDQSYRHFVYAYDKIEESDIFDALFERILNIYQTEYLEKAVYAWNDAYSKERAIHELKKQCDFYQDNVKQSKEKVVVIISDAFRYESAEELSRRFMADQNCETELFAMSGTLPSYTQVGMAELLPHDDIEMTDDYDVLIDGNKCSATSLREKILQTANPNSAAIAYDSIRNMKASELKEYTSGKEVIYIYHNTVDARGEQFTTENNVFDACQEAIENIFSLVKTLSKSGNVRRFLITADHGFIYNRKANTESDKISHGATKSAYRDRRFIIDTQDLSTDGVYSIKLGEALGNLDERYIMLPKGMSIFKAGGGMNYVHGGSSPQELIIPKIFIKTKKGLVDTEDAKLVLVTGLNKVTNLITSLDFLQEYPVSDTVKAVKYKIFFATESGQVISNEVIHSADNTSEDPRERMIRIRFDIKRQAYSNDKNYYLKIVNDKTGKEILSKQVIMDLPFTDNFGF